MDLSRGEIVLVEIPYHQVQGAKVRPAVVILDTGDEDFLAAPVTSQARAGNYEIAIGAWQAAGLNVPSSVRVHKMAVLPKRAVKRELGQLTPEDLEGLPAVLCRAFCP